ncbi:DNA-binding response OmpR family regulator [Hungatella effluvii]|uniref:Stage 0 sporulation protein A homolog n=1 Tax=Hungatella effluvii TaxID=1096246 RepID=A0A2V3Y1K9_9FIRM|nr:response regulator transcription factor [Hungatella effluvii]PXX52010.1 DNA-binding response OmpR family regulator [Hungatella effluvii]
MKRNILVISKEKNVGHTIEENFVDTFTTVYCVRTSTRAMEMIMREIYNLIIFDIFIQDMEGEALLQIIRRLSNAPILVLTKQLEIETRIRILNLGADDCMVWPTTFDELIIRSIACMKRGKERIELKPIIKRNIGLVIDPSKRLVELQKRKVDLTKREFDILYLLSSNPGVVFSKEQIYDMIWEDKFIKDDGNIMSHIGRLRKKLGQANRYIQTIWGIGYRFTDEAKD